MQDILHDFLIMVMHDWLQIINLAIQPQRECAGCVI